MDDLDFKVSNKKGSVIVIIDDSRHLKIAFDNTTHVQVILNKLDDANKSIECERNDNSIIISSQKEIRREVLERQNMLKLQDHSLDDEVAEVNSKTHFTKPQTDHISKSMQSTGSMGDLDFKVSDRKGYVIVIADDSTHMKETFDNTVHVQVILNKLADLNRGIGGKHCTLGGSHKKSKREVGEMDEFMECPLSEPRLETLSEQTWTKGQDLTLSQKHILKLKTEIHESGGTETDHIDEADEEGKAESEISLLLNVEEIHDEEEYVNGDRPVEISSESECEMQDIKESGESFFCEICERSFKNKDKYDLHCSFHNMIGDSDENASMSDVESDVSCKDSTYSPGWENEVSTTSDSDDSVEEGWAYNCTECGEGFPSASSCGVHFRKEHRDGIAYDCDVCYERFPEREERDTHRRNVHGLATEYVCCYCGMNYDKWTSYQIHMRTYKDERPKEYKCTFCEETFKAEIHYKTHISQHGIYCEICKKVFEKLSQRNLHVHKVHLEDRDKDGNLLVKQCPFCTRFFFTEKKLERHKMTHMEKYKIWTCDLCQKRFSSLVMLGAHLKTIHNPSGDNIDTKQQCPDCGMLIVKNGLSHHMRSFHKEKLFMCCICQMKFTEAMELRSHMLSHKKKRAMYRCELCAMYFFVKRKLGIHLRAHISQKQFPCSFCDMRFGYQKTLEKHMERKHQADNMRTEHNMKDGEKVHRRKRKRNPKMKSV